MLKSYPSEETRKVQKSWLITYENKKKAYEKAYENKKAYEKGI